MYYSKIKNNLIVLLVLVIAELITVSYFDNVFLIGYTSCLFLIFYVVFLYQKSNILSPLTIFLGLYLFFVGLGPIGYYLYRGTVREDISNLILMGLIIFVVGYVFANEFRFKKIKTGLFTLNYNNVSTIKTMAISILLISLFAQIYYMISNRSLLYTGSIASGRIEASSGNGLLSYIGNLWSFATYIIIELYLKNVKVKKTTWGLIIVCAMLSMMKGFKSGLLNFVLIVFLMVSKRKKIKLSTIMVMVIGVLAFVILYNSIRDGNVISNGGDVIVSALFEQSYVGYINLQYVLNCFPRYHDFMHGYGYLINIIMLKPGPDLDFTLTLKEILGLEYSGGGVTPTILGELYLNFGFIGCGIGMFIVGVLYQKITRMFKTSEMYFIPAWLVVTLCITTRTGLANAEVSLLLNSFVYLCFCYVSKRYRIK